MKGFRKQVFKGIFWLGGGRFFHRFLGLLKTIFLARLLAPVEFGRFGVTLLILALLETFSETGFQEALIQKQKRIEKDLPSVWLINFLRGVMISLFLVFSAPFVAYFFDEKVQRLMYLLALVPLVRGLTNPAIVFFQRNLRFRQEFVFRSGGALAEAVVAVVSAFWLRSAWALVLGILAGTLGELTLSFLIAPLPKGRISGESLRGLFRFSRWITGSNILAYLTDQGDDWVVGKVLGAASLGFYQTAFRMGMMPVTQVAGVFSQMALPVLSRQPAKKRLAKTITLGWLTAYPAFFLGGILLLFAKEIVGLLLGQRWLPMVGTLKIIALFGMIRSLGSVLTTYFISQGRPQVNTGLNLLKLSVLALGIYPGVKFWGIEGAALVVLLAVLMANSTAFFLLIGEGELGPLLRPLSAWGLTMALGWTTRSASILFSFLFYLLTFFVFAFLIDKHLRNLFEQEILPHLPRRLKNFYLQKKVLITKRGWFEPSWRRKHKKASLREWQKIYDLKWQHEPEDSISFKDIQWIKKHLKRTGAKTVLDAGCGSGKLATALAKQGYQVIACDVSQKALEIGRKKAKKLGVEGKIKWIKARLEDLPLADGCVDVCLVSHVLEHVGDLEAAVREVKRVAKKAVAVIVPVEKKTKVVTNYHLQFFATEEQLVKIMGLAVFETNQVIPQGKNGYQREIIRYWGEK